MCETVLDPTLAQNACPLQEFLCDDDLQNETVLGHIFDIDRREARAYRALDDHGASTARDLAEHLDRHPSNVYEALAGLHEAGLATRRPRIPDHGGQEYVFGPVPRQEVVQIIRDKFEHWVTQMRAELDALESACDG